MNIGIIGVPGGWSSEHLADTVQRVTGRRLLVDMARTRLDLPSGSLWHEGCDVSRCDALIIKKIGAAYSPDLLDRLETLRLIQARGLPVYSRPDRILRVLSRLSCTVGLQLAGIPMPPTTITEDIGEARAAVERYGRAVVKPLYSTKARGMALWRAGPELPEQLENYRREHTTFYLQKAMDLGDRDLGVVFLGGDYLATYARCKTTGSWNTTTADGGRYAPFDPPQEIIDLAHRAQFPFGLDFTCVDVALTGDGPVVFEVSAFGGFRGLLHARNIDAADLLVRHILKELRA